MDTIALFGGGKIGEALLTGMLRGERSAADVLVVERYRDRGSHLSSTYGVKVVDVPEAAEAASTLVLAVKPQDIPTLLAQLAPVITPQHLVVSVAAGIPTAKIEAALPAGIAVVRCMPNTPALVDQAMTAIAAGSSAGAEHLATAEELLGTVGRVVQVPE